MTTRRIRNFMRSLLATRSVRSAYLLNTTHQRLTSLRVDGLPGRLRLRTGTSDAWHLRQMVHTAGDLHEYRVPPELKPRTIVDIGANTGIVSLCLHQAFPQAHIYAFEPMPENYALLEHNVKGVPAITPIPYGLGCERTTLAYYLSDDPRNFAGGTFYPADGHHGGFHADLPIVPADEAFAEYGISTIDLIKIDTEGAEYDILTAIDPAVLSEVKVIVGELHGHLDDEAIAHLEQWFDVERRAAGGRLSFFRAVNRAWNEARAARLDAVLLR